MIMIFTKLISSDCKESHFYIIRSERNRLGCLLHVEKWHTGITTQTIVEVFIKVMLESHVQTTV